MGTQGLGDLEQLALLAVLRLGPDAYAVSVRDEIERKTGRVISRGAIYVTLDRMERKGFLRSALSSPTAERGGKAKRKFTIEPHGMTVLQGSLQSITGMMEGLATEIKWNPGK